MKLAEIRNVTVRVYVLCTILLVTHTAHNNSHFIHKTVAHLKPTKQHMSQHVSSEITETKPSFIYVEVTLLNVRK